MFFVVPLSVVMMLGLWLYLKKRYCPQHFSDRVGPELLEKERRELGNFSYEEKVVFVIFAAVVTLWLTRAPLDLGFVSYSGWSQLFPWPQFFNDGTVAIGMALLLFVIPAGNRGQRAEGSQQEQGRILDADAVSKLPWGIVLLFGGGLALASGLESSGMADWIGRQGAGLGSLPIFLFLLLLSLMVTFLGELASNTAMAEVLLPVAGSIAVELNWAPLSLMVPVALACSMGFMLPVATPPNAIVFATGRLRIAQMASAGLLLNLVGAVVISLAAIYWAGPALGY